MQVVPYSIIYKFVQQKAFPLTGKGDRVSGGWGVVSSDFISPHPSLRDTFPVKGKAYIEKSVRFAKCKSNALKTI